MLSAHRCAASLSAILLSCPKMTSGVPSLSKPNTVNSRYIEAGYNEVPAISKWDYPPRVLNSFILPPYYKNTVNSKEYTGPLDFDITGVDWMDLEENTSVHFLQLESIQENVPGNDFIRNRSLSTSPITLEGEQLIT